ncbi:hypothetical protein QG37_07786 [Candidozyma auris]|uniref:Uncharacterized protein n=1 Tax=Candidozyma auris TaxID=498019 RepID=A0A0L0NNW0_CANAR|nr:hypothetical protein QG37_07786 [[Candida] auris]
MIERARKRGEGAKGELQVNLAKSFHLRNTPFAHALLSALACNSIPMVEAP